MKNQRVEYSVTKLIVLSLLTFTFAFTSCTSLPQKPKTIPKDDYTYLKEYLNYYIPTQMKAASIIGLGVNVVSDKEVLFS